MATLLADNAYGTLGSGLTATATTLNFTAGHGARFPTVTAPDVLYCCILNSSNILEEVIITAHTSGADSCTITRAAGGTTGKVWNTGDRIEARISSTALFSLNVASATDVVTKTGTGSTYVTNSSPTINSPTLTTPVLGTPTSGNLANCTGLPIAGGGTGQATALAAFTALAGSQSAADPGKVTLGALIFQWGSTGSVSTNGALAVTFNSAFPTACLHVFLTLNDGPTNNNACGSQAYALSAAGFTVHHYSSDGSTAHTYRYLAIGY